MAKKYVYAFSQGHKDMKNIMGGKGANLSEMTRIGLPVPAGFTISTEACIRYFKENKSLWPELLDEISQQMENLERLVGKKFSDKNNPLLVSVRSGAVVSMPGMMDTILNLGLNDESVEGLARSTGSRKFAYDSYRRFIQMFADVVMGVPKVRFDSSLNKLKKDKGAVEDEELTGKDFKYLVEEYRKVYLEETKKEFPQDPKEQLFLAIQAVFDSWENPRAKVYRQLHNIEDDLGTAVNVQSMVFGNMGERSGTGVAFTRDPATGENKLFGEYLINAQGEDVVAGIRTPMDISQLKETMPQIYDEFLQISKKLEKHYKDMQDIEFTIENEKLYILQTRSGKRTTQAAIKIAIDMVKEGLISKEEALLRIEPNDLNQLLHWNFKEEQLKEAQIIASGLAASPGAASGKIYFHAEDVVNAKKRGEEAILVRQETSTEDIEGMVSAEGILTSRGGMTSHAAVVARGMGKCCVAGCNDISVDEGTKTVKSGGLILKEGDYISLDGSTGKVYLGQIDKVQPSLDGSFKDFLELVDKVRDLKVRINADNPKDVRQGLEFGAEGIGLCRTEHMFFDESRILSVRKMILANNLKERQAALAELLPVQRKDFLSLYRAIGERPVTIRLLDPPLHEFLPNRAEEIRELAQAMEVDFERLKVRIEELKEFNPMLGHRGCRLAITYPEIYRMQVRAIIEAALDMKKKGYAGIIPEIMIPLVGHVNELKYVKEEIIDEIEKVFKERKMQVNYSIGTMLEVPRAAITADEIAGEVDFFSFGTNDLSQMGFGFSRDDAGKFLEEYLEKGIFKKDPFQSIDRKGIGRLMEIAIEYGKEGNPNLTLGICGEHGGEPSSIEFCYLIGLDYISCSPYRVPIAKLAAAQAKIRNTR
ncbi:MAG TPA: pyruvate, phosphate dikinase [Tissierellaceae bacterium]|nr:pyruvate, phosphate dikinase [Tissierellaceae bacterium]